MEETGIRIDFESIQYLGSQPWPFPQSCMVGFLATANHMNQTLILDPNEIVSAEWFHKKDVIHAATIQGSTMNHTVAIAAKEQNPTLPLLIPPKGVIARKLIDYWLENG